MKFASFALVVVAQSATSPTKEFTTWENGPTLAIQTTDIDGVKEM